MLAPLFFPRNRSAEHRFGKFPPCLQRDETLLGAPIAQFIAPMRIQCWRSKLPLNESLGERLKPANKAPSYPYPLPLD